MSTFGENHPTELKKVQRTLLIASEGKRTRLPKKRECLEGGWIRAIFDPVSLAALFGSLGYKVRTTNTEKLLEQLPEEGDTVLAGVPDVT